MTIIDPFFGSPKIPSFVAGAPQDKCPGRDDIRAADNRPARERLRAMAVERFDRSIDVPTRFVHDHAGLLARACLEMADRFARRGRLLAFGAGAGVTDARHVAVEFVHPVIVGKRALPALSLTGDELGRTDSFLQSLAIIGQENDIAVGFASDDGLELTPTLRQARDAGMLTIAFVGAGGDAPSADFVFAVPVGDSLIIQEVHEHLYHVLWELVHVFLDHRGPP